MRFGNSWVAMIWAGWMLAASFCVPNARADEPTGVIGNLPTTLPNVPTLPPRPMGEIAPKDQPPVSDYLESVTAGDSIIEVFVGRSRIITSKTALADQDGIGVIAAGDPTVIDFDVLPNPKMVRIVGKRVGVTDLTFVTSEGDQITYDVHVVFDLPLIEARMRSVFPDATFKLRQLREHVVIEGEARSPSQVNQIIETLQVYLNSLQVDHNVQNVALQDDDLPVPRQRPGSDDPGAGDGEEDPGIAFDRGQRPQTKASFYLPKVINLMRVPGPQQVMLKVTIAELNRVALRRMASDLAFGTSSFNPLQTGVDEFLTTLQGGSNGNIAGVFGTDDFRFLLDALRQNSVSTILAEPNLITMTGHTSRFQSGGEFPVPVPQGGSGLGTTTVQYKPFGVQLAFTPIIEDNGMIRLTVEPEVSDIDPDIQVSIVSGGDPVPGLRTRNASTTVQMREGQTLAIAGLLNDTSRARTGRIPLLGDIPYLGAFFTNDEAESREEELLIVVTPHLVSPIDGEYPSCLPGQEVQEPNDWEFYLLNRIEGRTGVPHRATTNWDDPLGCIRKMQFERSHGCGPIGFSR